MAPARGVYHGGMLALSELERERVLAVYGEWHAERDARCEDLAAVALAARVPEAAVREEFADPRELHEAALIFVLSPTLSFTPAPSEPTGPLDEQLRALIRQLLENLLGPLVPRWRRTLLVEALARPSAALDTFIDNAVRPHARTLDIILRDLSGGLVPPVKRSMLGTSVVAECLFYLVGAQLLARLEPEMPDPSLRIEQITEHIAGVITAAIGRHVVAKR